MALTAFISYSHADEKALERLHKHLAMLRREGSLEAWTDHEIIPGDKFSEKIDSNLEKSGLFIALVSPDYLDSKYCYDREFKHAQQLAAANKVRVIPVILEPCDWLSSPLSEYMALPKDGKAIAEWANQNNAYLDVVTGLRRVIEDFSHHKGKELEGGPSRQPIRLPKIKQDFDAIQRSDFADQAFEVIHTYFQSSCRELNEVGDGKLKAKFENMDSTSFTCTVVNRSKRDGSEAHITVRNGKGRAHWGDIVYVFKKYADSNTANGSINVETDDYNMFLVIDGFSRHEETKYSFNQAAEALWIEFVKQAGIEYE